MGVSWQEKIPHLDEVGPSEFGQMFSQAHSYEVSEKIDGQNLSFGVDSEGQFFTKTKRSNPVYDAEFYEDVPYLSGFQAFHRDAEDRVARYLRGVQKNWDPHGSENKTLQLFGELLPYSHTNTVKYGESFGQSVVLFDFKVEGDRIRGLGPVLTEFQHNLITKLEQFAVYSKPIIDSGLLPDFSDYRDPAEYKAAAIEKLDAEYGFSILGEVRPEGYVVRNKDTGQMVKLVDKSRFTEANKETHRVSNDVQSANRNLKVGIRQRAFNNSDVLTNWDKAREKVADELAVRKQNGSGGYDSVDDALSVLLRDIKSENNLSLEIDEVVDEEFRDYVRSMSSVTSEFLERADEDVSQIAREVAEHKIRSGLERAFGNVGRFRQHGDLVPLVRIALGPTRVSRIRKQFVQR